MLQALSAKAQTGLFCMGNGEVEGAAFSMRRRIAFELIAAGDFPASVLWLESLKFLMNRIS
ncbi:hypothetical protein [Comamonas resistens]|uniref:hypothetical protein n=1 Tax=Comamonas resistens TaxID=3046670 RepID=UPI0039BD01E6